MKRLLGMVLGVALVISGCITGFFFGKQGTDAVYASPFPPMPEGVRINYHDNNMFRDTTDVTPDNNGDIISFDAYGGFASASEAFLQGDRLVGTTGTFQITLPEELAFAPFSNNEWRRLWVEEVVRFPGDLKQDQLDSYTNESGRWHRIVQQQYKGIPVEDTVNLREWGLHTSPAGTQTARDRSFTLRFDDYGIYHFTICTLIQRAGGYGSTGPGPSDFVYINFTMVVRRQPPVFRSHFPQNRSQGDKQILTINYDRITDTSEYILEFRQEFGGIRAESTAFFDINDSNYLLNGGDTLPLIRGLPDFLEFKRYEARDTNDNSFPRLIIGRKTGENVPEPREGSWDEIRFRITFPDYDDVDEEGNKRPFNANPYVVVTATMIFQPTPKASGFPYWTLVAAFGIMTALGMAWYLCNRFSLFVQMRDIRKKRSREEAEILAKENMEKMRENNTDDPLNPPATMAPRRRPPTRQ